MSRAKTKKAKRLRESSGLSTMPPPAKVPRRHRKQQWAFAMLDGGSNNTSRPNTKCAPQQDGVTMKDTPQSDLKKASDDEQSSIALCTYGGDEVADDESDAVEYDGVTYRIETHGKSLFDKARYLSYIRARCGMRVEDLIDTGIIPKTSDTDEPENELDWSMLLLRRLVWLVEITVDVRKINSELKRAVKTRMDRHRTKKSYITHVIVGEVVEIFRERSIARAKEEGVEWRERLGL
ncbi:hypothetical protein CBER1_09128 [Cercospora berteroae]|uniref:Uncharacterized protein n=1 Tax=Cercospora berteroae TaxID=357750 RepID=A0A2S6BWF4_9PEZI|nr:hypothetical protein CBER1_09128 [Cercospora berteroae]